MAQQDPYLIDARDTGDVRATSGNQWRLVTDTVMGGVSQGRLSPHVLEGRRCLRMQGEVKLDNNGGFVQMALDLSRDVVENAPAYTGLSLEVYGNEQAYNVHLRTRDMWLPWQSYRASFAAPSAWTTVHLPFSAFQPYRTRRSLSLAKLKRIGLVAIGREFAADLCLGRIGLYRD